MNWTTGKVIAVVVGASLLSAGGVYLLIEISRLRQQNQELITQQQQKAVAEVEVARQTRENEMARSNREEMAQLRGELAQLRQQQTNQAMAADGGPRAASFAPGAIVTKDQLAYAGYDTPEAAFQTATWAALRGSYDAVNDTLSPQLQAAETQSPNARALFEFSRDQNEPLFKSAQVVASKTLSPDIVELKVKIESGAPGGATATNSTILVQSMVKLDGQWKLATSAKPYDARWERSGEIKTYGP